VGRVAPWLPLAAAAALGVGALALEAIDARDGTPTDRLLVPIVLTYAFFGGLIASRQPRNPVGWLLSLLSLSMIGSFFISRYAVARYEQALPLPARQLLHEGISLSPRDRPWRSRGHEAVALGSTSGTGRRSPEP